MCSCGTFDKAIHTFDGRSHDMLNIQQYYAVYLCIAQYLNLKKIVKNFEAKTLTLILVWCHHLCNVIIVDNASNVAAKNSKLHQKA